jgi:hypothetical protein
LRTSRRTPSASCESAEMPRSSALFTAAVSARRIAVTTDRPKELGSAPPAPKSKTHRANALRLIIQRTSQRSSRMT